MVERIDIVVSERGSRTVRRSLNDIGGSADRSARSVDLLRNAILALGGAQVVRSLVGLVDTFTNLQNRLRTVTDGQAELTAVTRELFRVSQDTRASFENTAELYARVGLATRDLGISQRQTIEFTESLNQALILSGASSAEASAGLIQLSQGLASGTLRGDELRSVLEQLPVVADVIADSLGVTRGELRELGEDGRITADIVLQAFAEAREELNVRFAETVPTIGQAFQVLRNAVLETVGAFDTANGLSARFAAALIALSNNIETVTRVATAAGVALAINFARVGIGAAISGLGALSVAILTNPLGFIVTSVTLIIAALVAFGDQLSLTGTSAATVFDFISVIFARFVNFLQQGVAIAASVFGGLQNTVDSIDFADLALRAARGVDVLIGVFEGGFDAVRQLFTNFPEVWGDLLISGVNRVLDFLEAWPGILRDFFQRAFDFVLNAGKRFVNDLVSQFNRIPGLNIPLSDVVEDGLDQVFEGGRLTNPFEGAAASVGDAAVEGFAEGLNRGFATEFVEGAIAEAEANAVERIRQTAIAQQEIEAATAALDEIPPAVQRADTSFEDFITRLNALLDGLGDAVARSFDAAEDALTDFFVTGELGFRQFVDTIQQEITRLAVQTAITDPLRDAFAGIFGNVGISGGGIGGGLNLGSFLPGFQEGGAITVGGIGGVDRNLLSLNGQPVARVSRGETINVSPGGAAGVTVVQNITTPDANSFGRSQEQIARQASATIQRATRRNG